MLSSYATNPTLTLRLLRHRKERSYGGAFPPQWSWNFERVSIFIVGAHPAPSATLTIISMASHHYELYQRTSIGIALADALDELIKAGQVDPHLALKVLANVWSSHGGISNQAV
jgi:Transcription initiation factor IIA, gamma subunit, helical domain